MSNDARSIRGRQESKIIIAKSSLERQKEEHDGLQVEEIGVGLEVPTN